MTALNDSERMLLQRIMAAGAIDEAQVGKIARKLTGEEMEKADVDAMVSKLADAVRPFALDVRRGVYDDGKMYVAVCNTSSDPLTQFSSNYRPWEIVLLRKAIEEIVESEEGVLDESDIVNLRENTTISEVTELLRKLMNEKWLAPGHGPDAEATSVTLGPRSYLELIAFLRDLDIKKCSVCQYELLQGAACRGRKGGATCPTLVHSTCLERYEEKGLTYKCPTCKTALKSRATAAS